MRIDHAGHFEEVLNAAKDRHATSSSVQSYWTFCNFRTREQSESFVRWCEEKGKAHNGVNTERPFVPYEVAVRHPR